MQLMQAQTEKTKAEAEKIAGADTQNTIADTAIKQATTEIQNVRLSSGNVFPTEAIAEAAKKHAEWWRAFDMADEDGKVSMWSWTTGELHVSANDSKDSNPRWQSEERARAWVDAHGGEAHVSEMLTKGRVFRFKWGGE